jgi:hypothetical protein
LTNSGVAGHHQFDVRQSGSHAPRSNPAANPLTLQGAADGINHGLVLGRIADENVNLANFLRQLVLPKPIQGWTLTTLWEKLVKIGAKVVTHAK